jgi:hypothetical protein
MAPKILATVLAIAVLTVGGYTYWQYADGGHCCGTKVQSTETPTPSASPCCQEPSRTSCFTLPPGEGCCDDLPSTNAPEVLDIPPREVN